MVRARNADPRRATQSAIDRLAVAKARSRTTEVEQNSAEVVEHVEPPARRSYIEPLPVLEPPSQSGVSW
jgi:hypothetical protein